MPTPPHGGPDLNGSQTSAFFAVMHVKQAKANGRFPWPNSQMSIFSAMLSASSNSTPKYRTALATLAYPIAAELISAHKSGCAARRAS